MPSNGTPLQGASRFPICARDPRAGSELSGKAKFELLLTLGLAKLPSVQADRRGEVGGGVARPEQGVCSLQMTAAHMYENRMVVIHMR